MAFFMERQNGRDKGKEENSILNTQTDFSPPTPFQPKAK
jgi:hypothetical protein